MDYQHQDFIPQPNKTETQITILYTNDMHGDVVRIGRYTTAQKKFAKQNRKTTKLTLAGGDLYLGKNEDRNDAITKILNLSKLEYSAIGNHELDGGSEFFEENIEKAKYKFIGTNLVVPPKNPLNKCLKNKTLVRSHVVMKNGTKFALLGVSPSDKPIGNLDKKNKVSAMSLEDTIKAINAEAEKLEKQGVDKIILLSHEGYWEDGDLRIARETQGIDIIIGGHTHTVIDGVNKDGKTKNLISSKRCEPVIITQAGSDNAYVGYLDVLFDKKGVLIEDKIKNKLVSLDGYKSDKKVNRILKKAVGENEIIAEVQIPFIPTQENEEREMENPSANYLLDGMLRRGQKYGAEVSLINAPSMKSSRVGDTLTKYDVCYRMIPYNDKLLVIDLTEKQFVDLLNSQAQTIVSNGGSQMLHCAGMRYTISRKAAKDGKICVKNIEIKDKNGNFTRKINSLKPDKSKTVRCVINDYLMKEERLLPIFKGINEKKLQVVGKEQEVFIEQVKMDGSFKAKRDGRITVEEL
ncbi:MAG: 5'-nucleotidase C-terminal domain-containing protein [Candidatus Gastranaerophilales bacterium]|nr:5'-nucleotidase C-terminal domain-containing protein [Candidatus Gastranaerophilales bacterium]